MIISVDGADGVGKTSLAKKLAQALNFEFVGHPLWAMLKIKSKNSKRYNLPTESKGQSFVLKSQAELSQKFFAICFCALKIKIKTETLF